MNKRILIIAVLIAAAFMMSFSAPASNQAVEAQDGVELRILWYNDGNEGEVLRDLLDEFEAQHEGITVEIDVVAYGDLHNILQSQVEGSEGTAPDMARVTDTARFVPFYLDLSSYLPDPAYWEENFAAPVLGSFRASGDDTGLYGFPTNFTITGPYINRTLFDQAGVDVPSDIMDEPTWGDWVAAAEEVAELTGTPYAIAIDRSGHRVWGPSLTIGATYLNEDGSMTVDSPGFRETAEMIIDWHEREITPIDVWVGSGDSYASGAEDFTSGELVMLMSGSWQIQSFDSTIGDSFDWQVVPNPSGPGGSTGIPGGAVMAGLNTTAHPEEVAMVMDFLVQQDVLAEFSARTLFIPGHIGVSNAGVEYVTDSAAVLDALTVFLAEVPKLSNEAYGLQYSPIGFVLNTNIRDRLTQVIVGEITLDEAIERIQEAVDEAYASLGE